ncbi:uncharacterized protein [Nicotiana tomentosiformis]|uniref:uncharacterized protein n=1 Tax=Nicotiana tomentosiformis TaxID=4098 RepID=UPI00388C90C1
MEPWQDINKLEEYRRKLGIHSAYANLNGKIWAFVDEDIDVDILMDMEQQLTLKLLLRSLGKELVVTLVYVKCNAVERIELWDYMYHLASDMESPCLVGGDFNVILYEEEKYGGLPVYLSEVQDFGHCVDTCALYDRGFKGSLYTWWDGRSDDDCIFKKLDRFLTNQQFQDLFPALEVVKENWHTDCMGNPFIVFQSKMKKIKIALAAWSREIFEDIFKQIAALEDVIKVKHVVFGLNGDGFTSKFYQTSWDIIGDDVLNMVRAFFCGAELPKYITHTNLVLLPKKKNVATFSDMRPITLSNFSNKIIYRVIHERLMFLLPTLISPIQAGFFKRRSIVENILLTQEIITDIRKRGKPSNVVIKLEMAKAYDRVSWLFLTKVLRKMGFGEIFIDMVFRLVSSNWYLVLLNGQPNGFFKSSRGIKQGDSVSPTLFILVVEVLGRALDALFDNPNFIGFGMPK